MANQLICFTDACKAITSDINRIAIEQGVSPCALVNALAPMIGSPARLECREVSVADERITLL
jgi:hypothetical protein